MTTDTIALLISGLLQVGAVAYFCGRLTEKVNGVDRRVVRLEKLSDSKLLGEHS